MTQDEFDTYFWRGFNLYTEMLRDGSIHPLTDAELWRLDGDEPNG